MLLTARLDRPASCTGVAVKVIEGWRACNVPLWLDPPNLMVPGAKLQGQPFIVAERCCFSQDDNGRAK